LDLWLLHFFGSYFNPGLEVHSYHHDVLYHVTTCSTREANKGKWGCFLYCSSVKLKLQHQQLLVPALLYKETLALNSLLIK